VFSMNGSLRAYPLPDPVHSVVDGGHRVSPTLAFDWGIGRALKRRPNSTSRGEDRKEIKKFD